MFIGTLPPWFLMWAIAVVVFSFCKIATLSGAHFSDAPVWRRVGYLFLWPGMHAREFLFETPPENSRPGFAEWFAAGVKFALGVLLFWIVPKFIPDNNSLLHGWTGMLGLIFMLHFGAFHLLSCAWRAAGVHARPLMVAPLCAVSLSEFWGKRWNTAFRDLTHRFLFRPMSARIGARGALFVGFVASGVVHDAVISIPAGGGHGGPTLFFLLQAAGLFFERSRSGRAIGLTSGWRGRLFTLTILAAPLFALFHPPFVRNVILPFMKAVGA